MNIFKKIFNKQPPEELFQDGFTLVTDIEEEISEHEREPKEKQPLKNEIFEWLDVICVAVISVVVIFSLVFRIATISGDSMLNTLIGENNHTGTVGDKVIITNFNYEPQNGDIVVVSRNAENTVEAQQRSDEPIIKRVIAVGGQTVDINFETGTVYVDGMALDEPYISSKTDDKYDVDFPLYVPKGYIFVLGDNRGASLDSRTSSIGENGLIDTRYVLGHAVYRIFPFDRIGGLTDK